MNEEDGWGRRQRSNREQLDLLLSIVENDPSLYKGSFTGEAKSLWESAAVLLNKVGNAKKDGAGWRATLKDQIREYEKAKRLGESLSDQKQRIADIVNDSTALQNTEDDVTENDFSLEDGRTETSHITRNQLVLLISLVETEPFLHLSSFPKQEDIKLLKDKWKWAANLLNKVDGGVVMTAMQWKYIWKKQIERTEELRKQFMYGDSSNWTTLEQRIFAIMSGAAPSQEQESDAQETNTEVAERVRNRRSNRDQLELLVSLVEKDKFLHTGSLGDKGARIARARWDRAAKVLNQVGGAVKEGVAWRIVWKDQIRDLEKLRRESDGEVTGLSSLKQRIAAIIDDKTLPPEPDYDEEEISSDEESFCPKDTKQRTTRKQLELLISLVQKDRLLHTAVYTDAKVAKTAKKKWEEAATALNELGGALKNGMSWRKTWQDQVQNIQKRKGRKPASKMAAKLKQRIMGIIGAKTTTHSLQLTEETPEQIDCHVDVKMEPMSEENPTGNPAIKSEPVNFHLFQSSPVPEDWMSPATPQPDDLTIDSTNQKTSKKHQDSLEIPFLHHGVGDLIVTVRSMDIMNLIPAKTVTGDVIFSCGTCTYSNIFKTSEQLIIHHFREHSDKYQVRCNKCNIILGNNNILNHVKYHFDAQDDEVNGAPNVGPDIQTKVFDDGGKKFFCGICKLGFAGKNELEAHLINIHGSNSTRKVNQGTRFSTRNKTSKILSLEDTKTIKTRNKIGTNYVYGSSYDEESHKTKKISNINPKFVNTEKKSKKTTKRRNKNSVKYAVDSSSDDEFQKTNKPESKSHKNDFFSSLSRRKNEKGTKTEDANYDNNVFDSYSDQKSQKNNQTENEITEKKAFGTDNPKLIFAPQKLPITFKCIECKRKFPTRLQLKSHLKIHFENSSYLCQFCGESYTKFTSYRVHLLTHKKIKEYRCEQCQKQFRTKYRLKTHMRHHIPDKNYLCPKCGEAFQLPGPLATHLRKIHKTAEEFECSVCNLKFNKNYILLEHLKEHPDNPRPFQCTDCSKCFSHDHDLRKHTQLIHAGGNRIKPHKCHLCPKSFTESNGLKTHIASHTKPFKCSICSKAFALEHVYKRHLDWHSGKRYPCEICEKKFSQAKTLADHMNLHTGAMPYQCLICEKRFPVMNKYYYHLSTAHN